GRVADAFGPLSLAGGSPRRLMAPTTNAAASTPAVNQLDQFQCYEVSRSHGAPHFQKQSGIRITTALETATIALRKPLRLCLPADVDGSAPSAPTDPGLLLCYEVDPQGGVPRTSASVDNQFGAQHYKLGQRREFCAPATMSAPGS